MSHWTGHLRRLSHLVKMYSHTMILKLQFGITVFLHHGHELLAGNQYAEFKIFLQKQVKLFCKDYKCKTVLQRLQMKTVQTAFTWVLVTGYFLEIWSLQMQPVSSNSFSVTSTSHVYYQGHFVAGRIMSMKNSSDAIGNQTVIFCFMVQFLNQLHHHVLLCLASTVLVS
jgi:hypothetical protein